MVATSSSRSSPTPSDRRAVARVLGAKGLKGGLRVEVLTDWPAGGFVGIHGTDHPQLIPGHISHGCIRMRNHDILALAKLMPLGTPLTIM